MIRKISLSLLAVLAMAIPAKSQEFFDTSDASKFFTFGARIGFNTSNRTFAKDAFNQYSNDSWGTGFDLGVLANLNFKEYLSIQPGLFYESRSGNYAYATSFIGTDGYEYEFYQLGHLRSYNFTVPIMGIVKFNIAENIKWSVEFGPYLQFKLKEKGQDDITVLYREPLANNYSYYTAKHNSFDFGFKMGTGLTVLDHYYIGVHYLAGACHTWSNPAGGKNKEWMFTIGYDL